MLALLLVISLLMTMSCLTTKIVYSDMSFLDQLAKGQHGCSSEPQLLVSERRLFSLASAKHLPALNLERVALGLFRRRTTAF
ncbi:hypothetical protein KCU93_g252, partial [Aureobasidium melanogenum]